MVFQVLAHRAVVIVAHHSIVVIDNGRGHAAVGIGVREGVGCRLNKFFAEIIPVSKKGGEVLALILVGVVVVIVIEEVAGGIGFNVINVTGRN